MPFVGGHHTRITNPRWRTAAILEKSKNRHISAAFWAILTKFGTMMQFDTFDRPDRWKFVISKIQNDGGRRLKNRKMAISQPQFKRFKRNLARWRSSALVTVCSVTNLRSKEIQDGGGRHPYNLKLRYLDNGLNNIVTFQYSLNFLSSTCTSRHQQNRGYCILLLCTQFSHGLVNSAVGQIPCSTERISCSREFSLSSFSPQLPPKLIVLAISTQ